MLVVIHSHVAYIVKYNNDFPSVQKGPMPTLSTSPFSPHLLLTEHNNLCTHSTSPRLNIASFSSVYSCKGTHPFSLAKYLLARLLTLFSYLKRV